MLSQCWFKSCFIRKLMSPSLDCRTSFSIQWKSKFFLGFEFTWTTKILVSCDMQSKNQRTRSNNPTNLWMKNSLWGSQRQPDLTQSSINLRQGSTVWRKTFNTRQTLKKKDIYVFSKFLAHDNDFPAFWLVP